MLPNLNQMSSAEELYNQIFSVILLIPRKPHTSKNPNAENTFQPSSYGRAEPFIDLVIKEKRGVKILDCGCGISPVITFLCRMGFTDVTGIDLNTYLLNKLTSLNLLIMKDGNYMPTLLPRDIYEYNYKGYDFIYSFNPSFSFARDTYYLRVLNTMKIGATFCESYPMINLEGLAAIVTKKSKRKTFMISKAPNHSAIVRRLT